MWNIATVRGAMMSSGGSLALAAQDRYTLA